MLAEAFPEDTGVYTVKATNELGEVECSSTLEVAGMIVMTLTCENDLLHSQVFFYLLFFSYTMSVFLKLCQ